MKKTAAPVFPLVLLALLAGGTFWLDRASHVDFQGNNGRHRHDPDFIVEDFETRHFDLSGHLQHQLNAKRMRHYPDDESTEVETPSLLYYAHTPPTHLKAQKAWISKDGKEIRLYDQVQLTRPATDDQAELTANSSELHVFPDEEIARTQTPVTLINGLTTLQGQGLEADHRKQTYLLTGQVRGIMNRPTPKNRKQ